jgi:hypothetical protein
VRRNSEEAAVQSAVISWRVVAGRGSPAFLLSSGSTLGDSESEAAGADDRVGHAVQAMAEDDEGGRHEEGLLFVPPTICPRVHQPAALP